MDLLNLSLAEFETFMFVFFRVGAMILLVPILGSRQIPATMKVGLVLFLSLAIFPVVMHQSMPQPRGVYDLGIHLLMDALIGVAIGFITRLLFAAVQVAGTVIDFQMGFWSGERYRSTNPVSGFDYRTVSEYPRGFDFFWHPMPITF